MRLPPTNHRDKLITMKRALTLLTILLLAVQSAARADDELVVYPPVPGLAASKHYQVRVRSAGDGGEWQSAFAWETACETIKKIRCWPESRSQMILEC